MFYSGKECIVTKNTARKGRNMMGFFSKFGKKKEFCITSPISGQAISAQEIEDETFAAGLLGYTVGILPAEGKAYAPAGGTISIVFETGHAVGLQTVDGAEVLLHIGIDTVSLNGEPFHMHVKEGDRVRKGDLLVEFDRDAICTAGYSTTTAVIITNADAFDVIDAHIGTVTHGDTLLTVSKK